MNAEFTPEEYGSSTVLNLKKIEICNFKEQNKLGRPEALKEFEKVVINK